MRGRKWGGEHSTFRRRTNEHRDETDQADRDETDPLRDAPCPRFNRDEQCERTLHGVEQRERARGERDDLERIGQPDDEDRERPGERECDRHTDFSA